VIPIFDNKNNIVGVLDVDSDVLDDFDETDQIYLEKLCGKVGVFFAAD
jgi:GAF domain-containing protein